MVFIPFTKKLQKVKNSVCKEEEGRGVRWGGRRGPQLTPGTPPPKFQVWLNFHTGGHGHGPSPRGGTKHKMIENAKI